MATFRTDRGRIILRIGILAPFGEPVRGVSPYADQLAAGLEKQPGIEIRRLDIIEPYPSIAHPGGAKSREQGDGIRWTHPSTWKSACPPNLDILHIQYWTGISLPILISAARRAKRLGYPVAVTIHNSRPHENIPGLRFLENRLFRLSSQLIVHHKRFQDDLLDRGIDVPSAVIPHGISTKFPRTTSVIGRNSDEISSGLYILTFGNIRPYKGMEVLLDAWEDIERDFPEYVLVVAGRIWSGGTNILSSAASRALGLTRYSKYLANRLSESKESSRITLVNRFMTDEELDQLIFASKIAIFPYRHFSAQSGAACRAAGRGIPLLVSDVGALPDLVADRDRQVARPGDAKDLAEKLQRLLRDSEKIDQLRTAQNEHIRQFDWKIVTNQHANLYHGMFKSIETN